MCNLDLLNKFSTAFGTAFIVNEKISGPFINKFFEYVDEDREAPSRTIKFSLPEPSVPKTKGPNSISRQSLFEFNVIYVAAAASPNIVRVPRSSSLRYLL